MTTKTKEIIFKSFNLILFGLIFLILAAIIYRLELVIEEVEMLIATPIEVDLIPNATESGKIKLLNTLPDEFI